MMVRCFFSLVFLISILNTQGQVSLPQIFKDSMVLQCDTRIKIWGWASKGENINITFNRKQYKTKADRQGNWQVWLAPTKAGGPFTMTIVGKNKISFHNVLVGEVWICSGQSNMEHQMKLHDVLYEKEIATADYPSIRQFKVPNVTDLQSPRKDIAGGNWKSANSNDIREFSAVAWFFAKALYQKYKVPIGIINVSWGGVPIESLMSEASLQSFPDIMKIVKRNKDTAYINARMRNANNNIEMQPEDLGVTQQWYQPDYIPKGWRRIAIPGYWEDQGVKDLNGTVWYRKEIELTEQEVLSRAKLFLGRIVDADELYFNGKMVGSTAYMYPQRRYEIPQGLLKHGKNLIVVRVTNNNGKGGFVPDKPYQLVTGSDTIALTGYWHYKVGKVNKPSNGKGAGGIIPQYQPTALYNAMLLPIAGYSIKGFTWYQGESNIGKALEYASLFPTMIKDWRNIWGNQQLPFLFVQLPGFLDYNYLPSESSWALFREAQAKALCVANTGMAVCIDLGEWNDIHPDRKKEVGERLALAARKLAYGEPITASGPVYKSSVVNGSSIVVTFSNAVSGLKTMDGEMPAEFAIAGADKKFVWAKAKIEGDKLVLSAEGITDPKYVRYAWADNPVNPNLINQEGLPAAPFRTDE